MNERPRAHSAPALILAVLGIVFGDIGTSPLYALKEAFHPDHGIALNTSSVFGVLSLLCWAIVMVVAVKYVWFIMRADNHGEGGPLALMALGLSRIPRQSKAAARMLMLGLFGACMFYGDAAIAPAISVLSAVEGLHIAAPHLSALVLPITLLILTVLFAIQRYGAQTVGALFGPVMLLWFITLAALGLWQIAHAPAILGALNPVHALRFMSSQPRLGVIVLGSVFLALTGAEALYADMGHFGARPIRLAWYAIVMPALVLNYFGQGALLLTQPWALENPFYWLAPDWALFPLILLATSATVIAAQAVISGAFSLTSQAIQLGLMPRMNIIHTSARAIGQIYIPLVNGVLLAAVVCIALGFRHSGRLAAAYGIAVATTMIMTTALACVVMLKVWRWHRGLVALISAVFITVDSAFFGANLLKVAEGGWLPLSLGGALFFLLMTWTQGRARVQARAAAEGIELRPFIEGLLTYPPHRVEGTAVYLMGNDAFVPTSLLHNLKHNKVLHQRTLLMTFVAHDVPYVDAQRRIELEALNHGLFVVRAHYGFNETPDVQAVLHLLETQHRMAFEWMETSFFIARETVTPAQLPGMPVLRARIFAWLHRNAAKPTDFFKIPANRVVELGTKLEI
ncbi:KUP family K(+) transporter [Candidatus Glomeribacter gigasporarum BEG34]|uniref:Probable potassium transport system protein Kup n=1 Tax=Candidatus Glomeribacter gigasporarum BEG34 TaxID=1070319 RepID=G2JBQ8_9BURK|nr:potassium transporter Kup [Candidatus Glomeribacter gigasporarum]CCD30213.1 KUP family K(+) transporter [Candidatus Glomeribacter gigasporarum BEG34]